MEETIRRVLVDYARLPVDIAGVRDDDDLYALGFTSHSSVNVMLGLEEAFNVEFPDELLRKGTFQSISAMAGALRGIVDTSAH